MTISQAIRRANSILPGRPAPDEQRDTRWQAIIRVGEFVETEPEAVWAFVERWGKHPSEDLRAAIATCLLEHLLEYHFDLLFPRVERLVRTSKRFAETLNWCAKFGQAKKARNAARLDRLLKERGKLTRRFSGRASRAADRQR
jgi:hypothetical protein